MKSRIPKSFDSLPDVEKERLRKWASEMIEEVAKNQIDHEEAEVQKIWIMYACIILKNAFHMSKDDLICFIANWRSIYRKNSRIKSKEEQQAWIEKQLGWEPGEYPKEFLDSLEGENNNADQSYQKKVI